MNIKKGKSLNSEMAKKKKSKPQPTKQLEPHSDREILSGTVLQLSVWWKHGSTSSVSYVLSSSSSDDCGNRTPCADRAHALTSLLSLSYKAHALTSLRSLSYNAHALTSLLSLSYNAHALTSLLSLSYNAHALTSLLSLSYNAHALTSLRSLSYNAHACHKFLYRSKHPRN